MVIASSNSGQANKFGWAGRALAGLILTIFAIAQAHADAELSGRELELTVRNGDTLIALAEQYLSKPAEWSGLQRLNRVANPKRLVPGSTLRIPVEWLRENAESAEVLSVAGSASREGSASLTPGDRLPPGTILRTGADGFVTLRVPDGSLIAIQPKSEARLAGIGRYVNTDIFSTVLRMVSGRVEAVVDKLRGPSRFEVQTDLAVAGVRGTHFRVAAEAGARPRAQAEVLEGRVEFAGASADARAPATTTMSVALAAGFGSVTDDNGKPRAAVSLLAAPEIIAADGLQERLVTRFRFPAITGASNYRAQVARDKDFRQGIAEGIFPTAEIKFADLPDGDYFLRARAADALGLEGRDAILAFKLKARPEPPLASAPAQNGKLRATIAEFAWAANPEAGSYRIQLAEDEAFARIVQDEPVSAETFTSKVLPFGDYYWRIRSIKGTGAAADPGPWGDARKFTLRPPPKTPEPPEEKADGLAFSWSAEPGQTFVFQIARDPLFTNMFEARNLTEPQATIARPPQGSYYLRVRATDADGFVGPFTAPQRFTVINRVIDATGANLSTTDGQPVRLQ